MTRSDCSKIVESIYPFTTSCAVLFPLVTLPFCICPIIVNAPDKMRSGISTSSTLNAQIPTWLTLPFKILKVDKISAT